MAENRLIEVTDADFEDRVLGAEGISIVDFWAPWCGPCHTMTPALESFSKANAGKATVFKLDVDDNPKTAVKYEIKSVPTIIYFSKGEPVHRNQGAMSEAALQERLNALL